jgi:hypothetical protein
VYIVPIEKVRISNNNDMFDNTIALKSKTATTHSTVSAVDFSVPGRVIRKGGTVSLVIGSIPTKENPGYITRRVNVRLNERVSATSNALVSHANTFSQFTFGFPEGEYTDGSGMSQQVAALINFLYSGGNAGTVLVAHDDAVLKANLFRLMNEEA